MISIIDELLEEGISLTEIIYGMEHQGYKEVVNRWIEFKFNLAIWKMAMEGLFTLEK